MLFGIFREKCIRRIAFCCIPICLIYYIYIENVADLLIYRRLIKPKEAHFIYTAGCHMIALDVMNDNIRKYTLQGSNISVKCKKHSVFESVTINGTNYLKKRMAKDMLLSVFNVTRIEDISCVYTEMQRVNDWKNTPMNRTKITLNDDEFTPIETDADFIKTVCFVTTQGLLVRDVHFWIKNYKENRTIDKEKAPDDVKKKSHSERLSVMIVGIDSVSHMNFLRQMKRTASYIHNKLSHIEFWGYNKIGSNTYPNLIPLLTNLNVTQIDACDQKYFDSSPLIWKQYKKAGFTTIYGEDTATLSLFNYERYGFVRQPTDYYLRPILLEMEKFLIYKSNIKGVSCAGARLFTDVLFEFAYKMIPKMKATNTFSLFWWTEGLHEYFNYGAKLDGRFQRLFQDLEASGVLNKTLLLFMSDHGSRWGEFRQTFQGMMEDSQPLLIMLYPKWLAQRYPTALRNLKGNSRSLVTTYDIHATLQDLINLDSLNDNVVAIRKHSLHHQIVSQVPRGISLFLPIPDKRNCEIAQIPAHFCLCQPYKELPVNNRHVKRAARFAIITLNDLIKPYPQCRMLALQSILKAYTSNSDNLIADPDHEERERRNLKLKRIFDIKVRIRTIPGLGIFEATMRFNNHEIALAGVITRINAFKNQTYCIENYRIEMYCYCY